MVPGSDEENAETFANTGVLENKYHYFSSWLVDNDNPNAIIDKANLVTDARNSLSYDEYLPVYNEGAKKVRSITVKESNYFNILQTIAETFEAWLDLEITRNSDGGIVKKTAKFKNYLGQENYANFRYGVNLRDIQRTTSSKNIVTKLIVKQNTNELGKDGFCTIARAGANPTGENYIYDFQYYHN
jgi:phage minor structural protein